VQLNKFKKLPAQFIQIKIPKVKEHQAGFLAGQSAQTVFYGLFII